MLRSLPIYNFWLFGSTPGSAIPFLWECSRKSGPRNMFVNMGVLPMSQNKVSGGAFVIECHGFAIFCLKPLKTI